MYPRSPLKGSFKKGYRLCLDIYIYIPRPPNVPLLRAFWSLLDGIYGVLKGSWGVLVFRYHYGVLIEGPLGGRYSGILRYPLLSPFKVGFRAPLKGCSGLDSAI